MHNQSNIKTMKNSLTKNQSPFCLIELKWNWKGNFYFLLFISLLFFSSPVSKRVLDKLNFPDEPNMVAGN